MAEITDADQLTKTEFSKLIRRRKTWLWTIGLAIAVGVIIGAFASPGGGAIAVVVVILLGIANVYFKAGERAEDAFYDAYAKSHGLRRTSEPLEPATPLLRKGDRRRTDERFTGQLNPEFQGSLVLWTYTEVSRDSKGNRSEIDYPFTVVAIPLDEVAGHLGEMVVEKTDSFGIFDKLEDALRGKMERLTLESQALDDRFEVFVGEDQDPVWVRRLFSPSFIVWLTGHPIKEFAFEFGSGELIAYVPKHREGTEGFDEMIGASCELAGKLRDEAISNPLAGHSGQ